VSQQIDLGGLCVLHGDGGVLALLAWRVFLCTVYIRTLVCQVRLSAGSRAELGREIGQKNGEQKYKKNMNFTQRRRGAKERRRNAF
jgi:hypothetical protein